MTNSHNTRAAKLTFHIPHGGALHGLAGYFEAVLYGNVGLSIHPQRIDKISKDMLSWFPLFFPFKVRCVMSRAGCKLITDLFQEPLYLPSKSELQVTIWRLTNQRQVWYEWYAEAFLALPDGSPLVSVTSPPPQRVSLRVPTQPSTTEGSPFVDDVEIPETPRSGSRPEHEVIFGGANMRLVKIGQTSLHNPGGRSSWIGL